MMLFHTVETRVPPMVGRMGNNGVSGGDDRLVSHFMRDFESDGCEMLIDDCVLFKSVAVQVLLMVLDGITRSWARYQMI
jgi:hypothetical protein